MIMKSKRKFLFSLIATFCITECLFGLHKLPVQALENVQIADAIQKESASDETYLTEERKQPNSGYVLNSNSGTQSSTNATVISDDSLQTTAATSGNLGTIKWNFSDNTLTITGTGAIPDFDSSDTAPWYGLDVKTVTIENGITSIGTQSFVSMSTITAVNFPNTLKVIKTAAFYECSNITSILLPSGTTTLDTAAFAECSSLSSFSGVGLTSIGSYAFQNTAFTTFEVPKGVTEISTLEFFGNTTLESYTVASGNTAFVAVDGILYNKSKTVLALYPCNMAAKQFTFPSSVKTVGEYAFYNTQNLATIAFSNVTTLEEGAFYRSSLSGDLVLSDKITSVGYYTFEDSTNLTSVKFGKGLKESSYCMFEGCTGITSIDFGSLKKLGMRTFLGCNSLIEVTLPSTITEWDGNVFNSCIKLESFTSEGLTQICYADFAQCYSLKTVTLSKVQKIARQAFANCTSLKEITLPASTTWVDANAFSADVTVTCLNKELVKFGNNGLHYAEKISISGKRDYQKAFEVLTIVNKTRKEYDLPALTMDTGLLEAAMVRAGEQAVLFSHTRPDGSSCFTADKNMYAENVAIGQTSASNVMTSWMNSSGHKANILLENATTIGIGCFYIDGVYTWVQCFGYNTPTESAVQKENQTLTQSMYIPKDTFTEAIITNGILWEEPAEYTYKLNVITSKTTYNVGQQAQLKLKLTNPGFAVQVSFTSDKISWSSNNTSVATVDSKGKVSFIKNGSVTITGKTKYYKSSVKFTVKSTPTLTLKDKTVSYTGKTQKIDSATVKGNAGTIAYCYYSDSKCTKKLTSFPANVGTYYVKAFASQSTYSNSATSNVAKLVIKKAASKVTLKDKTASYTGKAVKISNATVSGSTGKVTYTYYSDSKCTKKMKGYPVKVGTYYVKATVATTSTHNGATSNVAKLIVKQKNPLTVSVTSKKYKAASNGKLSATRSFYIGAKKAKGTVTYTKSSNCKNYITVAKNGRVNIKKGTPKGTYKITITAKGTSTYLSKSINVTIKVY